MPSRFVVALSLAVVAVSGASIGRASAAEVSEAIAVSDGFDTVWGRAVRYALNERFLTALERRGVRDNATLKEAKRDLGYIELSVQHGDGEESYLLRVHLLDEARLVKQGGGQPPYWLPQVAVLLYAEGPSPSTLHSIVVDFQKALRTPPRH